MTTIEIIRELCKKNGISVTKLEEDLGYGNGSISKSSVQSMRSDRLLAIAKYFNVSMEYLMDSPNWNPREQEITIEIKLSEEDSIILEAFHNADEIDKNSVLRILNLYKKINDGDNK